MDKKTHCPFEKVKWNRTVLRKSALFEGGVKRLKGY